MGEDMTYEPVQTVAQLVARLRELERALAQADSNMVALAARNAELRARLDAVPGYAGFYSVAVRQFAVTGEIPMTFDEWLADAQPDDTDAPLTLAAIDDEDGDE